MSEMEIMQPPEHAVSLIRPPEQILAEAQKAAQSLQTILRGKKDPVIFNKQQYIEFEDWQVLGRFYGLTSKIVSTEAVDFGGVRGFQARAVVLDVKTGNEISAADAMCLNDEEKWSSRTKYAWEKGVKVKVGEIPVPMFQLRSMAQTRACAKALRNVLAWVVVLAGYKPTPAEEITGNEKQSAPPPAMPQKTQQNEDNQNNETNESDSGERKITEKQRKRFYALWKTSGKTPDEVKDMLMACIGSESTADIPVNRYEELCKWAEGK